jgi:photosystem II stability/assembly factor-like uncharacterized protein
VSSHTQDAIVPRILPFVTATLVTVLVTGVARRSTPGVGPGFDQPDAAAAHAAGRRVPADARLDVAAAYTRAAAQLGQLPRYATRIRRMLPAGARANVWMAHGRLVSLDRSAPTGVLDAWTPLGPGNIGGRTRVIRYHPTRPDTLFAAGVSGGVWQSADGGASWRPLASGLANLTVNALAIDPVQPDVMFAGTGEGYFREEIRGTGLPLRGAGIWLTRDGGVTWSRLPATTSPDFHWVNDLELGVGDPRYVYAATRSGVWRSRDRGESWTRLLATAVRGGCLELVRRPDRSDDTLFASCGSYEQATVYRLSGASGEPVIEAVLSEPGMGRTSLAIAPSDPDIVYALAASNDPGPDGQYRQALLAVYRSTRSGDPGTWEARVRNTDSTRLNTLLLTNVSGATVRECGSPAASSYTNMGWYVNVIAVDPRDPDRVWAGGVDWFRSDDGGRNWGLVSSMAISAAAGQTAVHVDQHGIAFHPGFDGQSNQTVIVANDGGLFRSGDARAPATAGPRASCSPVSLQLRWETLNRGLGITQFYHGLPFPDGERYLGGTQDNGTILGSDAAGPDDWRSIFGGDGGYVAIDPGNPQTLYVEFQWSQVQKTTNGGAQFVQVRQGLDPIRSDVLGPDANYLFVTPLVMDPSNAQRLWLGGEHLYRTSNGAQFWTKASAALPEGGLVSAIAVAAGDGSRVAAGSHRGHVLASRSALSATAQTAWTMSRPRDGWVTSVAFDPQNSEHVWVTYGNFGGAHVYLSADGGLTWQSRDGMGTTALPDIPVHSLVVDPDDSSRLYLGTDLGVFVSLDGGAQWMVEETGFGAAVTEWLSLVRDTAGRKRLFAFTHGRGAWRVDIR